MVIKLKCWLIIATIFVAFAANAQKYTLSGYLKDSLTNEFLIGATVQVENSKIGVSSNAYGFYSLTVDKGRCVLSVNYISYEQKRITIDVASNLTLDISLKEKVTSLNEVVVSSTKKDQKIISTDMSVEKISAKEIKQIPMVLGEADVIKAIQLLPGVSAPNEGSGGFNVRGGSADQNLILLDEAIVYNPSHLLGFFSVFNADALKDATIYKGGIPSKYGGRLSSVLDIRMREGNNKKFTATGGIGLLSSRVTLEAPIGKVHEDGAKGSFLLAARRSYADIFLPLLSDTTINRNKLYFYDLNLRSNYRLSSKDRIFLSGYFGRDKIDVPNGFGNTWGNITGTLRWNHLFSPKLFMNVSAIYSNYDYEITFYPGNSFQWNSSLSNVNFKADFDYYAGEKHKIKFGVGSILYQFNPGNIKPFGAKSTINPTNYKEKRAVENYAYLQDDYRISNRLTIMYGLRISQFAQMANDSIPVFENGKPVVYNPVINNYAKGTISSYKNYGKNELLNNSFGFEPRLSINYQVNDVSSIKLGYNRMYQYIHLLSTATSPTPLDIFTPSSSFIKPQIADQIASGYFRNFKDNTYEFSVEAYYKWMQNQFDFIDGASPLLSNSPETIILNGDARSYGLEFMVKKSEGRFTGWISYTLSKAERRTLGVDGGRGINNGAYYSTNYDKPHNIAITGNYKISEKWSISANFIYQSGRPATYPESKYSFNGLSIPEYSERNAYRLPDYHRLDIAATLKGKQTKRWKSQWVFGIYNVYNRQNAANITFKETLTNNNSETGLGTGNNKAYKLTYFGIIPSVSYEFKF
ncbi:MAG: TonB-dependent receptor [Bacteroidetes bacterium]|nr:TonB-dependent receptor [Bacteroidota bacterium]MCA6444687.1 TonB-dependent receptor [Bacteroidota bacterium]